MGNVNEKRLFWVEFIEKNQRKGLRFVPAMKLFKALQFAFTYCFLLRETSRKRDELSSRLGALAFKCLGVLKFEAILVFYKLALSRVHYT